MLPYMVALWVLMPLVAISARGKRVPRTAGGTFKAKATTAGPSPGQETDAKGNLLVSTCDWCHLLPLRDATGKALPPLRGPTWSGWTLPARFWGSGKDSRTATCIWVTAEKYWKKRGIKRSRRIQDQSVSGDLSCCHRCYLRIQKQHKARHARQIEQGGGDSNSESDIHAHSDSGSSSASMDVSTDARVDAATAIATPAATTATTRATATSSIGTVFSAASLASTSPLRKRERVLRKRNHTLAASKEIALPPGYLKKKPVSPTEHGFNPFAAISLKETDSEKGKALFHEDEGCGAGAQEASGTITWDKVQCFE
jgi:hypothetical protein